jgi:hypothetical protein
MTLAQMQSYVYRRTKTGSANWGSSGADLVIAFNNADEHELALIRGRSDNFYPTAWTTSDLSTGTATPKFDALYHELVPLRVVYQYAVENVLRSAAGFLQELNTKEASMLRFYGTRNYRIGTVTIASPGVFTLDSHGFLTNDRVILSTTGALPTGLSAGTWYYVIVIDENTFELAATRSGTAIATSGTQSGIHYIGAEKTTNFQRLTPAVESCE